MASPFLAARLTAARSAAVAELTPRERLLRLGAAALSDAELLSVLLLQESSSAPSALGQAVDLLREVGGFPGFLPIDADSLRGLGLSRRQAATLVSALELSHRLIRDELPRRPLVDHLEAVVRYAAARFRSPDQQILAALFLDPCCRLITDAEIFRGGLTGAAVEPGPSSGGRSRRPPPRSSSSRPDAAASRRRRSKTGRSPGSSSMPGRPLALPSATT